MAVPPQLVQFAFASGLDESQQDEVLDPMAAFPVLQNVRQDKRGGLSKRLGFTSLALTRFDGTSRSAGNRMGSHKGLTWTIDGTRMDTYAETPARWVSSTRLPEVSTTARAVSSVFGFILGSAYCGGYIATAAQTGLDLTVAVELLDGTVVRSSEVLFTSTDPIVIGAVATYSTYIVVVATDTSTANIKAWYLDTTSATTVSSGWTAFGNVATDKNTGGSDGALSVESLSNRIAIAYVNNSGGASQVTVKTFNVSTVIESATVSTSSATPDAVAIEGSITDTLWVAWNETTTIKVIGLDADALGTTLATTGSIGNVVTGVGAGNIFLLSKSAAGSGMLAFNDQDGNLRLRAFQTSGGACATDGAQSSVSGVAMRSRPCNLSGRYFAMFDAIQGGDLVFCDWTETITPATAWLRPVSQTVPSLTQPISWTGSVGAVLSLGSSRYAYPAGVQRSADGYSITLFAFDFASRKRWRSAAHNGSLYFAGGVLSYFDGNRVSEAAYMHRPKQPTAVDSGGGAGVTGPVRYVVTYEEVDDDGNWCLSGVSDPSTALAITDNVATVTAYPLVITSRLLAGVSGATSPHAKRMRVSLYRTSQTGEAPYYYVTSEDNDTLSEVTFSDSTTDAVLTSNRLLYGTGNLPGTNGAPQDRRCPPFCQDVESYSGMLIVASGSTLWYSGQTIDGEGVWFSPLFTVPVEGDDDITAIRAQDGTLYVFKARGIWAVSGDAPSDNGAAGGLGVPRKLAVDVGCIDPDSIVVTSLGIFFQSERGIELLGRGGAVQWVGERVQETLSSFPVVSSAVLDDKHGLVRFTLAASESGGRVSGSGRTVVYDLTTGLWQSVDSVTGSGSSEAAQSAAMIMVGGEWRYAWMGTGGTVYYERASDDASAHLDGSTWVTMVAETAWLKLGGIQGRQHVNRALLLARKSTRADLDAYLTYDYSTTSEPVISRVADDIDALTTAIGRTQLEYQLHDESEGQSIKLRLQDATPTGGTVGSGKGATWIAVTFEGTPKQGAVDLPESSM